MCFHISSNSNSKKLEQRFNSKVKSGLEINPKIHINGFEHSLVPVITSNEPNIIQTFNWGFIPQFTKDFDDAKKRMNQTLNARGETVFTLPSFKYSTKTKRCLVLIDGFYEWRSISGRKYPYFIFLKNREPFALAGIYNDWLNIQTGEIINSFSIITTQANPLMIKIHNSKMRMPLILEKEVENHWIDPNLKQDELINLIKPFDERFMEAYTISKLINANPKENNQDIQKPYEYPELAMFD